MYPSIMAVIAASIATHSTLPSSLAILLVIVLLAAGYFSGRNYVNRHSNRRNWK
jgi:positive regulator of sigma E activity